MEDLTRRGRIRHWGATTYGEEAPLAVLQAAPLCRCLQVAYSVLDRRLEKEAFLACRREGTGLVLRSVFLQGVLSERSGQLPAHLSSLRDSSLRAGLIAEKAGLSRPELALRFAAHSPFAHTTLFGTTSIQELEANLAAFAAGPLPLDTFNALANLTVDDQHLLNPANWAT